MGDKSKTKWLKFKGGDRLGWQFHDRTGFVWLDGHEKEVDGEYAEMLTEKFPKNFSVIEPVVPVEKQTVSPKTKPATAAKAKIK